MMVASNSSMISGPCCGVDPTALRSTILTATVASPRAKETSRVPERDAPWHASFTALDRDPDGTIRAELSAPGHGRTTLWADASFTALQLYIDRDRRPPAIAIEPMTAPPDALNSGEGLRWLAPGERSEHRWGIVAE